MVRLYGVLSPLSRTRWRSYYEQAIALGDRSHGERLRVARAAGAMLHPEFNDRSVVPEDLGMSIAWHKVPYRLGGWAEWLTSGKRLAPQPVHRAPDSRLVTTGRSS